MTAYQFKKDKKAQNRSVVQKKNASSILHVSAQVERKMKETQKFYRKKKYLGIPLLRRNSEIDVGGISVSRALAHFFIFFSTQHTFFPPFVGVKIDCKKRTHGLVTSFFFFSEENHHRVAAAVVETIFDKTFERTHTLTHNFQFPSSCVKHHTSVLSRSFPMPDFFFLFFSFF